MIKVKDEVVDTQSLIAYMTRLKEKQKELKDTRKVYYSHIALHAALKYKVFLPDFLLHPLVLVTKSAFEPKACITTKEDVVDLLRQVIEYEITEPEAFMPTNVRDKIISIFKKMNKSAVKNGTRV